MGQLRLLPALKAGVTKDARHLQGMQRAMDLKGQGITAQISNMRSQLRGKAMIQIPMLSSQILTADEQFQLVEALKPAYFVAGDRITEEGSIGDNLYIIERGECEVIKEVGGIMKPVTRMVSGDFFGQLGVLYDMPRSATVVAVTQNVSMLSLDRNAIYSTIPSHKIEKMKVSARTQVFGSIPLFSPLSVELKARIAESLRTDEWEDASVIFRENCRVLGDQMRLYILEEGQCVKQEMKKDLSPLKTKGAAGRRKLRKQTSVFMTSDSYCAPGSHFGLLECLYGAPHQYTLTTASYCKTLSISRGELSALFGDQRDETFEKMRRSVRIHLVTEILAMLDPEWRYVSQGRLERILDTSKTKSYSKWETILNQGQAINTICMLEEGTCIEYDFDMNLLKDPDQHTFESVENREHNFPGDHLGTIGALKDAADGKAVVRNSMVAVSECFILHIAIDTIEAEAKGMKQDTCAFWDT